jgi:hypothetical protein
MVRAILDGRKTMTRRVNGLETINKNPDLWELCTTIEEWEGKLDKVCAVFFPLGEHNDGWAGHGFCPYGQVGDQLWVRETWATLGSLDSLAPCELNQKTSPLFYKTDGEDFPMYLDKGKWRPSIFMPRWASRITLTITEVRVERLQEISEEDAFAEGCRNQVLSNFAPNFDIAIRPASVVFHEYWDKLNAKRGYGWEVNPWLWCISFEVAN